MTNTEQRVTLSTDSEIAVVTVNNPPVNALSQSVRAGLRDCFASAIADNEVKAIVLHCDGRTFMAGADIKEFGKPPMDPALTEVISFIEASAKPERGRLTCNQSKSMTSPSTLRMAGESYVLRAVVLSEVSTLRKT